ncbi:MAG: Na+-dependent transporter [Alphaproteobacteria bacterium]|nr:Na+-dependent transporter [Alphaproteobacteria bacterium]
MSSLASHLVRPLAWIGRQRTRGVALAFLIGIAVPPVGEVLRPYLTEAVIGLLTIAFLRTDGGALRGHVRKPGLVAAALVWTVICVPLLLIGLNALLGVRDFSEDLYLALMLQAIASPLMSAPAFAALLGLQATLVLAALIASSMLLPLSAPLYAAFLDLPLSLEPADLGLKLAVILAVAAGIGLGLRRLLGAATIDRRRDEIDGINILLMFVFAAAAMADVAFAVLERPLFSLGLTALAFAVFGGLLLLTTLVFAPVGRDRAFSIAMMAALRNMALMIAATGGAVPETVWLYFAMSQFPIYLGPMIVEPAARLILRPR